MAYPDWSPEMKGDPLDANRIVVRGQAAGLQLIPDDDLNLRTNGRVFAVQLSETIAWQYFITYVAHSLMAEIQGWFPWSLTAYGTEALAAQFDCRTLFG